MKKTKFTFIMDEKYSYTMSYFKFKQEKKYLKCSE